MAVGSDRINSTPRQAVGGRNRVPPAIASLAVVPAAKGSRSATQWVLPCVREASDVRTQNVGGSDSTSPPGGVNRRGKYVGRASDAGNRDSTDAAGSDTERVITALPESVGYMLCSIDVLELLGDAISPGCSRITVINPSAASKAATLTDASKRLLLE